MTTAELAAANRRDSVKWLGLAGVVGSALFALAGIWEMISPAANDAVIFNSTQYQLQNIAFVLAVVGWFAAALAFYLRGAMGSGLLGKIAIVIMAVGIPIIIADQLNSIVSAQITQLAPWQTILFVGALFVGPVLLGVAALRAKAIPFWKALYPVVALAVVPIVCWGVASSIGPGLAIAVQGLLWLGFAAMVYVGGANG